MVSEDHRVTVVEVLVPRSGGPAWSASCSCGWSYSVPSRSRLRSIERRLFEAVEAHVLAGSVVS